MLKELYVKNFRSIQNELLFSMEADVDRVSEFPEHVVDINGNKILKVASMYGPNGGGKSNLLQAILLCKAVMANNGIIDGLEISNAFSMNNIIEETVFFVDDVYEIGYNFRIKVNNEIHEQTVNSDLIDLDLLFDNYYVFLSETISCRKVGESEFVELLSRDSSGKIISDYFEYNIPLKDLILGKGISVVKYLYDTYANSDEKLPFLFDSIKHLYTQIMSFNNLNAMYGMPTGAGSTLNFIAENKSRLIYLLAQADIKIDDILVNNTKRGLKIDNIYFVRVVDHNRGAGGVSLSLRNESEGTVRIFSMLLDILRFIDKGGIFYCDDLNAYLHPKLTRAIIELFQNNKSNAQLIFNSHDLINMTNELFRRDEIWFVYRDEFYSTNATPLSSIVNYKGEQIRKDSKYSKQYLEGRYGADPFISRGLKWYE